MKRMATFLWVILVSVSLEPLYSVDSLSHKDLQENAHFPLCLSETEISLLAHGNDISYLVRPSMTALAQAFLTPDSFEHVPLPETKSLKQKCKDMFIDYIAAPVYIAHDRITHHGLSKKDICILGAALVALYGAKKGADHYHLRSAVCSWDFSQTRTIAAEDAAYVWGYKKHILLSVGVIGTLGVLMKAAMNLPIIERFKRSLTRQQKEIIASDAQLIELINNAHENPKALAEHADLVAQLNERQRTLLEKAIEKHKNDSDPLSLFDDFVMEAGIQ